MAEKTEKATPKKLKDARKKGQVAKSQDFPSAFTFMVSIIGSLFSASYLYKLLGGYMLETFKMVSTTLEMDSQGGAYFMEAVNVIMMASLPIMLVVVLIGLVVNFLVVGPVFSFEAIKFDIKKLNPVTGIKQKFKLKVLVELLKSIFKISGAAIIILLVIWQMLPEVVTTSSIPTIGGAMIFATFLKKVTFEVGIFFLLVAIFDFMFQKRTFAKEMMMEKFELKQEYKDTEGDPLIKGRRREMAREIAYSEGPGAAKRAKVIVTNPTHIAVALGFEYKEDVVPMILTMGSENLARKIIEIAVAEKIPIMRNVQLARELYQKGDIGDYIPKETYKAVAEILKWVKKLEEEEEEKLEIFK